MSNSSGITTSTWRLGVILNFVKKGCSAQGKHWDFLQVFKEDILVIYRLKSLYAYVSQIRMTIDLLPIKPQMVAILNLFFNETLKVTNSLRNEFSPKNHVKMRYYIKIYGYGHTKLGQKCYLVRKY